MGLPRARAASPGAQTRPRPEGSRGADPELSLGRTFGSISALPWYLRTGTTTEALPLQWGLTAVRCEFVYFSWRDGV